MAAWLRALVHRIAKSIDGDTKPMSASQKCEYLMSIYKRKRGTVFGLYFIVLLVEIVYLAISWNRAVFMTSPPLFYPRKQTQLMVLGVFFARVVLIILTVLFLALLRCEPVSKEEQKFMHSVLFDHHLEREVAGSQCEAIQDIFDTHSLRCESEFSFYQMTFMQIVCLSSALHGAESSVSSARTRGIIQLLFMRLWPMSAQEKEVALYVKRAVSRLGVRARLSVFMRVTVNTSVMELAAWLGLLLYLHTILSNGAVSYAWIGVYDELLRFSNYTSWDNSRGQDPRYLKDLIHFMSDALLACLALCSLFPIPVSASLILLLPATFIIQVAFETQPDSIRNNQLQPTYIGQSQLYILVSFYVLLRHNLHLLRNYRNDYLSSFRQRLDFLPQGVGHAPSNPAQDRMIVLSQKILSQMSKMTLAETSDVANLAAALLPNQPSSVKASTSITSSSSSLKFAAACSAINTLVCYLQGASTAGSRVCDLSQICQAAVSQCEPLLKKRSVTLRFLGQLRSTPLRVLLVDDSKLVQRLLERLLRNRGYYYQSCPDGESSVKAFDHSLRCEPLECSRFDVIIMDKEMPMSEPDGYKTAGVTAVRRIRELSRLQAEVEPGFRCPCIIGNSACTNEEDVTWVMFRNELELARQEAGMPSNLLILTEKMSSWSDAFDREVRQLCGFDAVPTLAIGNAPTVWGNPIRLEMMIRNLITNAIQYGKPEVGEHCVSVSYDLIDQYSRVHPCLLLSDQDDEVARSLTWQLSHHFKERTQRYVQVMVTDNGPGIELERMKIRLEATSDVSDGEVTQSAVSGGNGSAMSSVSNFGICLQRIVCPEIARCHGAMGVHSRIEPSSGCSFVVALPYCS